MVRNLTLAAVIALPGAAVAQEVTIAALGDSLTAGYGLPQGDGFVPQLEAWLEENGHDVDVLNAGVSGDTTAGGLSRLDWTLNDDIDAMIVALGANDALRGLPADQARANLDQILSRADDEGLPVLLIGIGVPGNYGAEYQQTFNAIYPDLAEAHDTLLVPDFLGALRTAQETDADARSRYMQSDGLHPNADGVALIVDEIGPSVATMADQVTP